VGDLYSLRIGPHKIFIAAE
jgi:hypothetical protein